MDTAKKSQTYQVPTDWKSEKWWRNRPVDERLFHTRIPTRWTNWDLTNLDIDQDVLTELNTWVANYSQGDGLFLYGKTGVGKSVVGQAVLQELIKTSSMSGRFVSSDRYIDMLKDTFEQDGGLLPEMYSMPYLLKYIQGVFDVVLLDGVAQERETEFSCHEIGSLIRRRYEDTRSMIITTSLSPMDFNRRYGDRVKVATMEMTSIRVH
jgi:DNA replication protein DnaC